MAFIPRCLTSQKPMSSYQFVAVDSQGLETRGKLDVGSQSEALRRIREMGLFPTRVAAEPDARFSRNRPVAKPLAALRPSAILNRRRFRRVRGAHLTTFTRQLATLIEAGMPLLRGLRILREQEGSRRLKCVIEDLALSIENGSSLAEAVAAHPAVFDKLYVNMIRAGEIGAPWKPPCSAWPNFAKNPSGSRARSKRPCFTPVPCCSWLWRLWGS